MSKELVKLLRRGCVYKRKRWTGDCHADSVTGSIDESATDDLMNRAADRLSAMLELCELLATEEKCDCDTEAA